MASSRDSVALALLIDIYGQLLKEQERSKGLEKIIQGEREEFQKILSGEKEEAEKSASVPKPPSTEG